MQVEWKYGRELALRLFVQGHTITDSTTKLWVNNRMHTHLCTATHLNACTFVIFPFHFHKYTDVHVSVSLCGLSRIQKDNALTGCEEKRKM